MSDGVELKHFQPHDEYPPAYKGVQNPYNGVENLAFKPDQETNSNSITIEEGREAGYLNKDYRQDLGHLDDAAEQADPYTKQYISEPLEVDEDPNCCLRSILAVQNAISQSYTNHKTWFWRIVLIVIVCLYAAYFGYAMYYRFGDEGSIRLLWVTCVVIFFTIIHVVWRHFGKSISENSKPCMDSVRKRSTMISWIVVGIIWLVVIIFVIVDLAVISKNPYNLVSACGILFYILFCFLFSYSPARVTWRPVAWGLALQFVFALLILRWSWGYQAFVWLGDRVSEFLAHTDAGSKFVFGDAYGMHFFAFQLLPVVVFFSTIIAVLYYLGVMQVAIYKISWLMQVTMGTTAAESMNAAGNIFIGQSEAPLLIRPLIQQMTRSELHAVMTGGFATIAGSVLAAYIRLGVPANHLMSASVMSAPAALAIAKLFYPETEKSKTSVADVKNMEKSPAQNIVEAASSGASASISLVANIAANLIAFLAVLHFVDATLLWFGARVGVDNLTFQFICSYVLWPFALVMGVEIVDCRQVARLLGIKTFLNEFIAYDDLGTLITNKKSFDAHIAGGGTWNYNGDSILLHGTNTTLHNGILHSDRSLIISTYALCGFANFGSIGIMIGALGAMAPHRKSDISQVAVRAMIAGNIACFMTASIAGLLFTEGL